MTDKRTGPSFRAKKSQEARILAMLARNSGNWVPAYRLAAPDDGPRILQFGRAIWNLRHGKFDGMHYTIENQERRNDDGEVHGYFRLIPYERPDTASQILPEPIKPELPKQPIESDYMRRIREEKARATPLFAEGTR